MIKFEGYSIGIQQTDDEIKENLKFRICPISTIGLLVSRSDMPNMRCFSIGGMKNQPHATLESFGTTEEIIISLTRSPSTTHYLLSSSLLLLDVGTFLFSCASQSSKFIVDYSDLAARRSPSKIF